MLTECKIVTRIKTEALGGKADKVARIAPAGRSRMVTQQRKAHDEERRRGYQEGSKGPLRQFAAS
jgi:hypothetical protein